MSIFVDREKLENPEKISSEQVGDPTTLKRKAIRTLGPGFDPGHIGARQALSPHIDLDFSRGSTSLSRRQTSSLR